MRIWKNKFKDLSMRYKLLLAYSVPLELCFLCITIGAYMIIQKQYREQILYSSGQSYEQAFGAVEKHFQNMSYILEQLEQKEGFLEQADAENLMSADGFQEEWENYLFLTDCLMQQEGAREGYRLSIYVPDELFYADSSYRFYPLSTLEKTLGEKRLPVLMEEKNLCVRRIESAKQYGGTEIAVFGRLENAQGDAVVARINWSASELEQILRLANLTGKGMSCLTDMDGNIVASSVPGQDTRLDLKKIERADQYGWREGHNGDGAKVMIRKENLWLGGLVLYSIVPYADFYEQANLVGSILSVSAVIMMLFILLISWILAEYYTRRLSVLNDQMGQIRDGNINSAVSEESDDEIGKLYRNFNYMAKEIRTGMLRQYRLGKDVKNAEMKALQAQINPHFLYNTLDLINWAAMDYNATEIMEIAQNLAKFYRVSLNHGKQIVTIGEELGQIRSYIAIENFHFDGAIHYEELVSDNLKTYSCINILLQPFVENSIMYSLAKVPGRETCHIRLKAEEQNGDILFRIEDDGIGMSCEQMETILSEEISGGKKGYGVKNVNFRIKLCYGEDYGVFYDSVQGKGTCASIKIPALTEAELEKILE